MIFIFLTQENIIWTPQTRSELAMYLQHCLSKCTNGDSDIQICDGPVSNRDRLPFSFIFSSLFSLYLHLKYPKIVVKILNSSFNLTTHGIKASNLTFFSLIHSKPRSPLSIFLENLHSKYLFLVENHSTHHTIELFFINISSSHRD